MENWAWIRNWSGPFLIHTVPTQDEPTPADADPDALSPDMARLRQKLEAAMARCVEASGEEPRLIFEVHGAMKHGAQRRLPPSRRYVLGGRAQRLIPTKPRRCFAALEA